jgi:hypothetical protein
MSSLAINSSLPSPIVSAPASDVAPHNEQGDVGVDAAHSEQGDVSVLSHSEQGDVSVAPPHSEQGDVAPAPLAASASGRGMRIDCRG